MIKIKRPVGSRPEILKNVRKRKTSTAYRDPSVREKLHSIQNEKCCYCEASELPISGQGAAIEHFWPQGDYPEKKNTWKNLLLICDPCNGHKLGKFPLDDAGDPVLIDPSDPSNDPEENFKYDYDLKSPSCGNMAGTTFRGRKTVEIIGLWDDDYRKKRKDIVLELRLALLQLDAYKGNVNLGRPGSQNQIDGCINNILSLSDKSAKYSGIVRFTIVSLGYGDLIP